MSLELIFRLLGMVGLGVAGAYYGIYLSANLASAADTSPTLWAVVLGLVGMLLGLVATPFFTTRPARAIRNQLMQMPASALLAGLTGLTVGLIIAVLLSFPLSLLPPPLGEIFPLVGALLFAWLGVYIFVMRQRDIFSIFRGRLGNRLAAEGAGTANEGRSVLLDTSVIIDGRVADVAKTGFISGTILVPKFVLVELQHIADSSEALRRNRGRRGLEVLDRLKKEHITIIVSTPYMDEAERCDRIALMQHGSLLSINTPKQITGGFSNTLLSITAVNKPQLIRDLRAFPSAGSVFPFGESIHYTDVRQHLDQTVLEEITQYLLEKGHSTVSVVKANPNIEDVFMKLMQESVI